MKLSGINCTVSYDAKRILLDYQAEHEIGSQGNALERLLTEFKQHKTETDNVQSK